MGMDMGRGGRDTCEHAEARGRRRSGGGRRVMHDTFRAKCNLVKNRSTFHY